MIIVLISRIVELYLHFPIHLYAVVLNWLNTGTNLPLLHLTDKQKKLRDFNPQANYTDRATAACRRN
jgi:hypothetical protein